MARPIGHRRWAIAEGYIPGWSNGPEPALESHETASILNAGETDAHVEITVYFKDREPAGPYRVTVAAERSLHLRFRVATQSAKGFGENGRVLFGLECFPRRFVSGLAVKATDILDDLAPNAGV